MSKSLYLEHHQLLVERSRRGQVGCVGLEGAAVDLGGDRQRLLGRLSLRLLGEVLGRVLTSRVRRGSWGTGTREGEGGEGRDSISGTPDPGTAPPRIPTRGSTHLDRGSVGGVTEVLHTVDRPHQQLRAPHPDRNLAARRRRRIAVAGPRAAAAVERTVCTALLFQSAQHERAR